MSGADGGVSPVAGALPRAHGRVRLLPPLVALALLAGACVATAMAVGSVSLSPGALLAVLRGDAPPLHATIVVELRMPRALAAFGVGGLLAVAGALMQVLLRNPLADPYVLGLSGGAGSR